MKEEAPSPKDTSTKTPRATELGLLFTEAMLNMDWDNPPKREPIKPLFPPKEKK